MPQTYESLRCKFIQISDDGQVSDDGIQKAEAIIQDSGGFIRFGIIKPAATPNLTKHIRGDILDAVDYLVEEWDYCLV